jgi:hypothetical protein
MISSKALIGSLVAAVSVVALGATQASTSSAPIVIPYAKTCNEAVGHCVGTARTGGSLEMQVTSFRTTSKGAQLTLTEWITVGGISFRAAMNGHVSPAGFIVLDGRVTDGAFVGAEIHQQSKPRERRRDPDDVDRRKLQLMPSSA